LQILIEQQERDMRAGAFQSPQGYGYYGDVRKVLSLDRLVGGVVPLVELISDGRVVA
jgi:hypothetical protein